MQKLRIGVIGTGHLGTIHTRLWSSNPNVILSGIFDSDQTQAQKVSTDLSCKNFESIEELLKVTDAVTIAVPTSLHHEVAMKAINEGVHCLIEKPIAQDYNESVELIEFAKSKQVLLQVGHVERFNPALASIKRYNMEPMFIEAHRLAQFKPRAIDVSVIHDLMIHDIDIMLWLIKSKVKKIDANGVAILTDNPDIANARITFENGAVANLTASRISARPMRKMRVFQKNSYISIDFGNQDVEVFRIKDDNEEQDLQNSIPAAMLGTIEAGLRNKTIVYEKPVVVESNAISDEQNAFINAIINKSPVAVSAEEAAEALRIADIINVQIMG